MLKLLSALLLLCAVGAQANDGFIKFIKCGGCVALATAGTADRAKCMGAAKEAFGGKCADACAGLQSADGQNLAQITCTFDDWEEAFSVLKECYECGKSAGGAGSLAECRKRLEDKCADLCKKSAGFLGYHREIELAAECDAGDKQALDCYTNLEGNILYGLTDIRAGNAIDCDAEVAQSFKDACGDNNMYQEEQKLIIDLCKSMQ